MKTILLLVSAITLGLDGSSAVTNEEFPGLNYFVDKYLKNPFNVGLFDLPPPDRLSTRQVAEKKQLKSGGKAGSLTSGSLEKPTSIDDKEKTKLASAKYPNGLSRSSQKSGIVLEEPIRVLIIEDLSDSEPPKPTGHNGVKGMGKGSKNTKHAKEIKEEQAKNKKGFGRFNMDDLELLNSVYSNKALPESDPAFKKIGKDDLKAFLQIEAVYGGDSVDEFVPATELNTFGKSKKRTPLQNDENRSPKPFSFDFELQVIKPTKHVTSSLKDSGIHFSVPDKDRSIPFDLRAPVKKRKDHSRAKAEKSLSTDKKEKKEVSYRKFIELPFSKDEEPEIELERVIITPKSLTEEKLVSLDQRLAPEDSKPLAHKNSKSKRRKGSKPRAQNSSLRESSRILDLLEQLSKTLKIFNRAALESNRKFQESLKKSDESKESRTKFVKDHKEGSEVSLKRREHTKGDRNVKRIFPGDHFSTFKEGSSDQGWIFSALDDDYDKASPNSSPFTSSQHKRMSPEGKKNNRAFGDIQLNMLYRNIGDTEVMPFVNALKQIQQEDSYGKHLKHFSKQDKGKKDWKQKGRFGSLRKAAKSLNDFWSVSELKPSQKLSTKHHKVVKKPLRGMYRSFPRSSMPENEVEDLTFKYPVEKIPGEIVSDTIKITDTHQIETIVFKPSPKVDRKLKGMRRSSHNLHKNAKVVDPTRHKSTKEQLKLGFESSPEGRIATPNRQKDSIGLWLTRPRKSEVEYLEKLRSLESLMPLSLQNGKKSAISSIKSKQTSDKHFNDLGRGAHKKDAFKFAVAPAKADEGLELKPESSLYLESIIPINSLFASPMFEQWIPEEKSWHDQKMIPEDNLKPLQKSPSIKAKEGRHLKEAESEFQLIPWPYRAP